MNKYLLCSGGMDSISAAYRLRSECPDALIKLVTFDYGQRHIKEREFVKKAAQALEAGVIEVGIQIPLAGCCLTDPSMDVPEGHYEHESMKLTVVPNRNAMMLSVVFALAGANKADLVGMAVHSGDHAIYPDCRPEFVYAFSHMIAEGYPDGMLVPQLWTPYLFSTKAQIVADGAKHGVPFQETWSCYKGGDLHCGKCGTCVERREAFVLAGVSDPTEYEL